MALSDTVADGGPRGRVGDLRRPRRDRLGPGPDRRGRRGDRGRRRRRGRGDRDRGPGRRPSASPRSPTSSSGPGRPTSWTWPIGSRGGWPACRSTRTLLPEPAIVVADDLAPSLTATLPRERLLGIALEAGLGDGARRDPRPGLRDPGRRRRRGPARRAARLAGADVELAIDGATGEVVIDPDDDGSGAVRRARRRDARSRTPRPGGGVPRGGDPRRHRGHPARQHRQPGRGAPAAVALGARGVGPVPDRVPVPRAGRRRRPRTSRPTPIAAPSRRSAAAPSRSACSTSAATSRSRTCRCRPRTTRSSASGRCGSPTTGRSCS